MLEKIIENLQSKSEKEKIKILWAVSAITAVFVFMIWISSFDSYKAAFNNSLNSAAESMGNLKASVSQPAQPEQEAEKSAENIKPSIINNMSNKSDKSYPSSSTNPNGVSAAENEIEEPNAEIEPEPTQNPVQNNAVKAPRLPVD